MKAQETSLIQLLNGPKQFLIPIYQRAYSWTEEQCGNGPCAHCGTGLCCRKAADQHNISDGLIGGGCDGTFGITSGRPEGCR